MRITTGRSHVTGRSIRTLERIGPWSDECLSTYQERACNALSWEWRTTARGANVEFLTQLTGLEGLDIRTIGANDTALEHLTDVVEFGYWNRGGQDLDLGAWTCLRSAYLSLSQRHVSGLAELPSLEFIRVDGLVGGIGRYVGGPALRGAVIYAKSGHPTAFDVTVAAPALTKLDVVGVIEESLGGLAHMQALRALGITAGSGVVNGRPLSLEPFAEHPSIEDIRIGGQRPLADVEAVLRAPRIRRVAIGLAQLRNADLERLKRNTTLPVYELESGTLYLSRA